MVSKSLDLGCGRGLRNPLQKDEVYGVDVEDYGTTCIKVADLCVEPIPFPDGMFGCVTAYDFLEHIPRLIYTPKRRYPFIELMNEIYRVLEHDGLFCSSTPIYPHAAAFQDPTHVNIMTESTLRDYFCGDAWAKMYGFKGRFVLMDQALNKEHLVSVMKKVPR